MIVFAGNVTAGSFVKSGGTSSQFLMADGSVSTGGSGISQSDADTRYVNVTGDTMTGNLSIENGSPTLTLKDTTDDDDQQINFLNNGGTIEYVIRTRDFTTAATGDGMFIGSISSDPLAFVTNNTTALTIDTSQRSIFAGNVEITGDTASPHTDNAFYVARGSDGAAAFRIQNTGEVVVQGNYFYASGSGVSMYVQNTAVFRGSILNDASNAPVRIADDLKIDNNLTVEGGLLHLGKADTASGHINAKELMTFNIDTDNDDTNRYFAFYKNGESGSGTELFRIQENGFVGVGTDAPKQQFHVHGGSTSGSVTKAVIGGTGGNNESHLYLAEHFQGNDVHYGFSFVADGNSSNNLLIKRHSNSTSGVTVMTINRDNDTVTFNGGSVVLGGTGRIQGIDTVSAGTDAVNKTYVDNAISGITEQDTLDTVTSRGATTTNAITTGNITANGSILGGGNLFLRSYNTDPKGIFFRDGFEYGDTNQYNLSITVYDDGDSSADAMNINAYDGIYLNVQSGTTPSTAFRVLNGEVRSYKTLIADSTFQMNDSNTNLIISGNTSGNATIDNNTGSIAFQANGSTVNSMTITSSAITLNENTTATGTFDPQGNILGAVIDDGNSANPLQVRRSAASTMQVGINFTVSPSSGSGFSRYLGVDSSADLRFGSNTNHASNALVLTTANYVSQFGSFAGDIIPSADSTYDLGSNSTKWAEGHFDHLFVGETGNNPRIDIYTESSNNPIADTFAQDTQKSYIYFNAGSGSNDPGFIMHETTGSPEDNEGVLHLVPSDDNSTGDYVSIHGTNDSDCIKLHTSGLIETANYQLQLRSAVGDVYIDDGLTVNGTIGATGGTSTTWNEAHDNMIISASVSGTSTKTLTLNQNDGGTITASWTDLQGTTVTAPNAPTNLSLSIVNNTVNVTFDASSTSGIDQYLVFGSANGGDYSLISVIEPASMGSTMSVIDDSFDDSGTQAYRVYAMKTGVMSSVLSGSVTYTVSTPVEPTNMSVVNLNTAFYIQWDPPSSNARFVTAYNVYKHEHATQGSLSRSSATLIYSGMNTSYMYEISGNNNLNYHQFWVETTVT